MIRRCVPHFSGLHQNSSLLVRDGIFDRNLPPSRPRLHATVFGDDVFHAYQGLKLSDALCTDVGYQIELWVLTVQ